MSPLPFLPLGRVMIDIAQVIAKVKEKEVTTPEQDMRKQAKIAAIKRIMSALKTEDTDHFESAYKDFKELLED